MKKILGLINKETIGALVGAAITVGAIYVVLIALQALATAL